MSDGDFPAPWSMPPRFCPKCGTPLQPSVGGRQCERCGLLIGPGGKRTPRSRQILTIIISLIVIAVMVLIAYALPK